MNKLVQFWYRRMEGPWAHYLSHFMGGFVLATIVGHFVSAKVGLIAGIVAANLKELLDKYSRLGSPEILAAVITIVGAFLAFSLLQGCCQWRGERCRGAR